MGAMHLADDGNGQRSFELPALVQAFAAPNIMTLPPAVQRAVHLLQQAAAYAEQFRRDRWEFAVDLRSLIAAGCNFNDLRWLLCAGFAMHGTEVRSADSTRRKFRHSESLTFGGRSCFVLAQGMTPPATELLPQTAAALPTGSFAAESGISQAYRSAVRTPIWDQERRELRINGVIVKSFKLPSPNQEAVLTALAEENWPAQYR